VNIKCSLSGFRVAALAVLPLTLATVVLAAHGAGARTGPASSVMQARVLTQRAPLGHAASRRDIATAGPFATLLFSRTEMTAAHGCIPDDRGIARLDTTVAPYLQSLALVGTGTLVTARVQDRAQTCTHFGDSLSASWRDATSLARNYGWSFVSHTATYPSAKKMASLTPAQAYAETCGSAATITAHRLPGANGLIAYPGTSGPGSAKLQDNYGQYCFAWGRRFNTSGTTDAAAARTPPYWQHTAVANGGACHDPSAPCYTISARGGRRYTPPSTIISEIRALQPGQWFTLQAYVLVTGTNPAHTSNSTKWDCTSPNPAKHWSNDVERYCWSDYQQILRAIAATPRITVTDPLTVGTAFGRPFSHLAS
jgi:hypothetical protein